MKIIYASIGILLHNNKILIEKNSTNSAFKGLWQFPGGKVELDETPFEALKREIKEELNVNLLENQTEIISFNEYNSQENKYYVVFFYLCKKWDGEITNTLKQELQWCSLDQLETLPFLPHNKSIIKKLHNLL